MMSNRFLLMPLRLICKGEESFEIQYKKFNWVYMVFRAGKTFLVYGDSIFYICIFYADLCLVLRTENDH